MSGFISYKEVLKRWKMSDYEFVVRFLGQGLIPYNEEGISVSPQELLSDEKDERGEIKKISNWHNIKIPDSESGSKKMFSKLQKLKFYRNDIGALEKGFKLRKERKLTPVQRHRIACREVAKKLWKKDPKITIADMAFRDEIVEACEGKIYTDEKTIRNWTKDLCPDRDPGRRPKKD